MFADSHGNSNQTNPFYEYNGKKGADMPYNMALMKMDKGCDGVCVRNLVHGFMSNKPSGKWANWIVSIYGYSLLIIGCIICNLQFIGSANIMCSLQSFSIPFYMMVNSFNTSFF